MTPIAPLVDVPNLQAKNTTARRIVALLDDNRTLVVATMTAGAEQASTELSFTIDEVNRLAEACLSGDARALTSPGLARKLSAATAVLFRVCQRAGSIQSLEDFHGGTAGYLDDQQQAGGDEDPGD